MNARHVVACLAITVCLPLGSAATEQIPQIEYRAKDNKLLERLVIVAGALEVALNQAGFRMNDLPGSKMTVVVEWTDIQDGPHDVTLHVTFGKLKDEFAAYRHDAWVSPPYSNPSTYKLAEIAANKLASKLAEIKSELDSAKRNKTSD